jgi:hypothetical protein
MYPPAQGIKNPQFNCSTMANPTKKIEVDPNRYILELLNDANNSRDEPEPVKQ